MDKNISDAVELLFKGAKMLAYHCLDCKMPLFKYEGKILCPSCKKEFEITENGVVIVKELPTKKEDKEKEGRSKGQKSEKEMVEKQKEKKEDVVRKHIKEDIEEDVKEILRCCIVKIIKEYLKDCKDLMVLEKIADTLNKLLIILEKLEEKKF
jgi:UPF0148 protein